MALTHTHGGNMNKNMIYAALPFAGVADVALMVKAFTGYSDPTLTVLAVVCVIIALVMVLKAFDMLRLPRYTGLGFGSCEPREIHHHHYHNERQCEDEDEYQDEDEESLDEAYDRGYEEGKEAAMNDNGNYDEGHADGYEARKAEEKNEAEELAQYILKALKMDKEAEAAVQVAPAPVTPTATATEVAAS